jgi:hypothetical protein
LEELLVRFNVSGEERLYPDYLWTKLVGTDEVEVEGFACDGCSNSPDSYRGYLLWPACFVHDWNYRKGNLGYNWGGRKHADRLLRTNLKIVLTQQNAPYYLRFLLPFIYWGRVRIWGASSYRNWAPGEKPLKFCDRVREAWGFFRDKRGKEAQWPAR